MILIGRGLDFDAKSERLIGKRLRKFRSRMLCSCQGVREKDKFTISGDDGEGVPPVPIPNTEVKPFSADGTWLETTWESRTLPDSMKRKDLPERVGLFFSYNRKALFFQIAPTNVQHCTWLGF